MTTAPSPTVPPAVLAQLAQARARLTAGDLAGAVAAYEDAIRAQPALDTGYVELIRLLLQRGDVANTGLVLRAVPLALYRQSPDLQNLHGIYLAASGDPARALPVLRALVGQPGIAQGPLLNNIASCHDRLHDHAACPALYEQAFRAGKDDADLFLNWAGSHQKAGDPEAAGRLYEEGLARYPDSVDLRYEYAVLLLKRGDFAHGFARYGDRWGASAFAQNRRPALALPQWDGRAPLRSLLVMPEQGIGDQVVFSALLPALAARVDHLAVALDGRLQPLLQRTWPNLEMVRDSPATLDAATLAERYDAWIPAGDLGRLAPEGIGWAGGPLRADPERTAGLRAAYRARFPGKRLVGLSWKSRRAAFGQRKSIPLADWQPLLAQTDCQFISLQYGDVADELRDVEACLGITVWADPAIDSFSDLDGLAAQIAALDLVITTSNTTAHLAAALQTPTWVLLPEGPALLWYWGYGERSAWYPGARLFRCAPGGDWTPTLAATAAALRATG